MAVLLVLTVVAHGRLVTRVDYQYGDDDLEYVIPYSQFVWGSLARGESPLWNPHSDLGTPLWTTGPYMGPYYPLFPVYAVLSPGAATNLGYLVHLLWAALGMFLLLRRWGGGDAAAAVGSLALVLSGHCLMQTNEGFLPNLISLCHLPWVVLPLEAAAGGRLRTALLAGLPLGLCLLGGNVGNTALVMFTAGLLVIAHALLGPAPRSRVTLRRILVLGLGFAAAALVAAVHWLPAMGDFLNSASQRPFQAADLPLCAPWRLITYGLPLTDPGRPGAEFVGVIPLLLAAAGLRLRRDAVLVAGLLTAAAGWLVIISPALGLLEPLVSLVPLLRMFNYTWLFGLVVTFGLAVAAGRGAAIVIEVGQRSPQALGLAARSATVLGLALLGGGALVGLLARNSPVHQAIGSGALLSLPWVVVAAAALLALLEAVRRGRLPASRLGAGVVTLVAIELVGFAWVAAEPAAEPFAVQRYFAGGSIARAIDDDGRRGRVLHYQIHTHEQDWALRRNEALIRRYRSANFEAKVLSPLTHALSDRLRGISLVRSEIAEPAKGGEDRRGLQRAELRIGRDTADLNGRLLDLANVAYLVTDRNRPVLGGRFRSTVEDGTARLWVNRDVLPAVRLVPRGRVVLDEHLWDRLLAPGHDPRGQVLLAPGQGAGQFAMISRAGSASGSVLEQAGGPGARRFSVHTSGLMFLVLSQTWHRDWQATVDGLDAPLLRADGCFVAVPVTAGQHLVELRFEPSGWLTGLTISVLTLLGLAFLGVTTWRGARRDG